MKKSIQKGFTLVELLIVVIILAILAAIVVPQFSSSTQDARLSALDSTLANIRSALELYAQQHNGRYPGAFKEIDGTATTSDAERLAALVPQLTLYSDQNGVTAATATATIRFGPYFKKADIPANPITNSNAVLFSATGTLGLTGSAAGLGWRYDVVTGQWIANDTNPVPNGGGATYDQR